LDKSKTVAVLPTGAVEAHGPHLPLSTDVIIAEGMARTGGERLAARGYEVVVLPPLVYTAAAFAAGFAGTISIAPATVTRMLLDIAGSLAAHEFALLAVANAHLDPAHLMSIHAAVTQAQERRLLRIIFPDLTRKPWALKLTSEFKSGACHAGQFESSVVMAERPELVREEVRRALVPNPTSLATAIHAGKTSFEGAGGPRAYFGSPAAASVTEGAATVEVLGAILEAAVLADIGRAAD
jgi:creatinine amidohydrolase